VFRSFSNPDSGEPIRVIEKAGTLQIIVIMMRARLFFLAALGAPLRRS